MPLIPALLSALVATVDAPITDVTVFTDQARVVRTAKVSVQGTKPFELPPLLDTVDLSSVRVEARGAEVVRIDIERLEREAFRSAEAKALIAELDGLDTELQKTNSERQVVVEQASAMRRLSPTLPPSEPLKAQPRLNAGGWLAAAKFPVERLETLQKRQVDLDAKLKTLNEKRRLLVDKAYKLGEPSQASGWKVVAHLTGNGAATISLSYLVGNARWTPSWDLQLDPGSGQVSVRLAGMVSQESGEDWEKATLDLSTAIPSGAVSLPRLLSWKIGTVDRFIPAPTPMRDYVAPAPRVPAERRLPSDEDVLRGQLRALAGRSPGEARGDLDERERREEVTRGGAISGEYGLDGAPSADRNQQVMRERMMNKRSKARPQRAVAPGPPPPSAPMPMATSESVAVDRGGMDEEESDEAPGFFSFGSKKVSGKLQPTTSMSLAAPPGYRAPRYAANSPVTLAGGYDLLFTSLQKETVPSAKGTRRVALWAQSWPVTVERKIFPALAPEAFLVAELKNPSKQVLPGGPAQLYVGDDPAGTAQLKLVSPGEAFTLPLGIDRAIRPVRNVALTEAVEGLFSKEEVTTYTVTIELVNPYKSAISTRIYDQLPVTTQKEVETRLLSSSPVAIQDAQRGWLEWRLTLKPNQKTVVSYSYTLRRPKGWKLQQSEVRP